jgi:selenide,water dikinase
MGGKPIMAIAIFGWPLDKLPPEVGQQVIEGGRKVCQDAGISLAGGHSIDAPEPIFGLAVTGTIAIDQLKQNNTAKAGDHIFLTKPLGIGILTTAQKKKKLKEEHLSIAMDTMCILNKIGAELAKINGVNALTDVTGFGLAGHLREVCEGSGLKAHLNFANIPLLAHVEKYLEMGCSPGGARRNFASFGHLLGDMTAHQRDILCDPQTSGGLLVMVSDQGLDEFMRITTENGLNLTEIGQMQHASPNELVLITV